MHSYIFNTDLGTFEITNGRHHRMYELWLENEKLGEYATAAEAADDVATFNTGYIEWDDLESEAIRVPAGIEAWREVKEQTLESAVNLRRRHIDDNPYLVKTEG
ncbi:MULTISPECIES: hypothetical protein [Sulfurimonas]|uniref:DUF2442 domain-containing protein n=1 Tax=Sulfurimonas diazotrophicus TaxID=3131939 RepID=A0ABZ3HCE0_9BACT